jgi:beta-glucosidase
MFWAGEEGGTAIADVLFGDYNPAGRLPYTVYPSVQDIPPMEQYDITQGFTYMYFTGEPFYAFGHGLSYTRFDYANLKVAGQPPGSPFAVQVEVRNSGSRAGDEVAQLYVRDLEASVKRPARQLVAFERVSLDPGQMKTVSFSVPAERLAFWDEQKHAWTLQPGAFEVMVGSSSADIRLRGRLQVSSPGQ